MISGVPIELLALPPLAIASGVDLYLTLLLIGAAPTMGLWPTPLPGALGDLDPPGVLLTVGTFYLLEFAAERFPGTALVWNAFHAIIRPVSGALVALLLLDGQPVSTIVVGCLVGGLLASIAHGVRTGSMVLRWLSSDPAPSALLVSIAEDVAVVGLVALTLDAPAWAFWVAVGLLIATAPRGPSFIRAFRFTIRLAIGRVFSGLSQRRWRGGDELPTWVTRFLETEEELTPGASLRGSPVGAFRLRGAPRFAVGWVVVRGGSPLFVFRRFGGAARIDLGSLEATEVREGALYRRVDLRAESANAFILFGVRGPGAESLQAEFRLAT